MNKILGFIKKQTSRLRLIGASIYEIFLAVFKSISFWIIVACFICAGIFYNYMSDESEYKANIVVELLSIAITAGLIDYIVNVIPQKKKKNIAMKRIERNINWAMFGMEGIITTTLTVFNISKTWRNVKLFDVSDENSNGSEGQLNGNINHANDAMVSSFGVFNRKTNKKVNGFVHNLTTYNDFVKNSIRSIKNYVDKITPFEYFYEDDINFVEAITQLQNCAFIKNYEIKENPKEARMNVECFKYWHTGKDFFEFVEIYRKLYELNYNSEYSKSEPMIGKDALDYDKNRFNDIPPNVLASVNNFLNNKK